MAKPTTSKKEAATVASAPQVPDTGAAVEAKPESAAIWLEIDKLVPWDRNPRHNEKAVEKVVVSLKRFGWGAPIVARKADLRIIAGHTRWLAAKKLKHKLVPVRLLDLSEADANKLAIADNKLGEIAEWNNDQLAALLVAMPPEDLADIGFSGEEMDRLLGDEPPQIERRGGGRLRGGRSVLDERARAAAAADGGAGAAPGADREGPGRDRGHRHH